MSVLICQKTVNDLNMTCMFHESLSHILHVQNISANVSSTGLLTVPSVDCLCSVLTFKPAVTANKHFKIIILYKLKPSGLFVFLLHISCSSLTRQVILNAMKNIKRSKQQQQKIGYNHTFLYICKEGNAAKV